MATFNVKISCMGINQSWVNRFYNEDFRQRIRQAFANGSQKVGDDPQIELNMEERVSILANEPGTINDITLHNGLKELVGKQDGTGGPVENIGIIYTSYHADHSEKVFGKMFDDGRGLSRDFPPREGCAVFLYAIADNRGYDLDQQILFTTIHELGHVFNLKHTRRDTPMSQSQSKKAYTERKYYKFDNTQRLHLAECEKSSEVWPGGSKF